MFFTVNPPSSLSSFISFLILNWHNTAGIPSQGPIQIHYRFIIAAVLVFEPGFDYAAQGGFELTMLLRPYQCMEACTIMLGLYSLLFTSLLIIIWNMFPPSKIRSSVKSGLFIFFLTVLSVGPRYRKFSSPCW